jgi:hypothetical protein
MSPARSTPKKATGYCGNFGSLAHAHSGNAP